MISKSYLAGGLGVLACALAFGCESPPPDSENGAETKAAALSCPAGQTSKCAYDPDVRRVICECVNGPPAPPAPQPWSGQSITLSEYPDTFGGRVYVNAFGWKAGDRVDLYVNYNCSNGYWARGIEYTDSRIVGADGRIQLDGQHQQWFCYNQAYTTFEVRSQTTTARSSLPSTIFYYWK